MVEFLTICSVCSTKLEHPRHTWMKMQREDGLYYLADGLSLDTDTPIETIVEKIKGKQFKPGWYCPNGHIPRVTSFDKAVEESMHRLDKAKQQHEILEDEDGYR